LPSNHFRNNGLRAEKRAEHADFPAPSKTLRRYLNKGLAERATRTGIVDQNIHWAELASDAFKSRRHLVRFSDISTNGDDSRSVLSNFFAKGFDKIG
jgi:hypothetical protein